MPRAPFFDLLRERSADSLLCVGLDPRASSAEDAKKQCIALVEATAPFAACFKPNAAFFERHGAAGWNALRDVIAAVPEHIPVLLDAKRGDIADTAKAYAEAAFDLLGADAITVSPYMGVDSLTPFLRYPGKGVFALCKTSNKGAGELQSLPVGEKALFEHVAKAAETKWNSNGNLGVVVGATDPDAIARTRRAAPSLWFLVPGVGAQGGNLEAALTAGLRDDCSGMLINASRAVADAADPAAAAKALRDEIQTVRSRVAASRPAGGLPSVALATALVQSQCARFGEFKLKSGKMSPIYIDLRRLVTHPQVLHLVAQEYARVLEGIDYDRLVGLPYAALPIATAISLHVKKPLVYPRREAKTYGTKAAIEGDFNAGDRVVIIDDLVTTGETKIEAIEKLVAAGLRVVAIVVLIDREMGAGELLGKHGHTFKAVTNLTSLLGVWRGNNAITQQQYDTTKAFLASKL